MYRKLLIAALIGCLVLAGAVRAQDATPEATMQTAPGGQAGAAPTNASVTATDQIVTNGMVTVTASSDAPAWVAIHADMNGTIGHVVGIAPLPAGQNQSVSVMIDGAMSTPVLYAEIHADTGAPGVFEFGKVPDADLPAQSAQPAPFKVAAIFAFDQQAQNNTVVVASAIIENSGWMVIHADDNGKPGTVLGYAPVLPGTNAPVRVQLTTPPPSGTVWPMLHTDDGVKGTYEFGTVANADGPIQLNGATATKPVPLTDAPTLLLADGTKLAAAQNQQNGTPAAAVNSGAQTLQAAGTNGGANFTVEQVVSPVAGFVDVHSDAGNHPGASLGHVAVQPGQNTNLVVALMPTPEMPMITPVVWPMLHADTNGNGQYEYNMVPGADLPVVYNGEVVTLPVNVNGAPVTGGVGGSEVTPGVGAEATAAAGAPGAAGGAVTAETATTPEAITAGAVTPEATTGP
jgi:hypothetical protein